MVFQKRRNLTDINSYDRPRSRATTPNDLLILILQPFVEQQAGVRAFAVES